MSDPITLYEVMLSLALVAVAATRLVMTSKLGWGLAAIREDEDTAASVGVPVFKYKLLTFALGSFFAGLVGAIYPLLSGVLNPSIIYNVNFTMNPIIMSILGGTTYMLGPVIGAVILVPIAFYLSYIVMSALDIVVYGVLLIVLIVLRPKGVLSWLPRRG
jgi:branched-chain amino acid transport system permease protein